MKTPAESTDAATYWATNDAARAATYAATYDAARAATFDATHWAINDATDALTDAVAGAEDWATFPALS